MQANEMSPSALSRVGFLGPAGTFTEEALLASAAGDAIEPIALASIYATVDALRRGDVRWAIVPIENSLDGSVSVTLDLLAEQDSDVQIAGEALLRVRHSLIAAEAVELAEIDTVLTHPQVPGQCARFLRAELAHARILPASSTAGAVRTVIDERVRGQAAIGTVLAASIYGGTVLREDVEDRADNETRFVWLARSGEGQAPPLAGDRQHRGGAEWKTSLVFWGAGAESPGWLVRCLDEFARREINLTKIESRPRRERLGRYMFFADLNGRVDAAAVSEAIDGLRAVCEHVGVLGCYPAAQPAVTPPPDGG
ncbi:MAG TPA: prephenate dehydratase [Solirubrobacteraceae bacterium]|jgi:prephenate dehydratase|nr:prephenate dehydratase [Solirubrobacteraceae bacterium]